MEDFFVSKHLSSNGKIAYASLCANILQELFLSDFKEFSVDTLNTILTHLTISLSAEDLLEMNKTRKEIADYSSQHSELLKLELSSESIPLKIVVKDIIDLALMNAEYDARWRVLIKHFARSLGASELVGECEASLSDWLVKGAKKTSVQEEALLTKKRFKEKVKRIAVIASAAAGGGALIGITGGLAAPIIIEGVGLIAGATSLGAAVVTTLSTTAGTTLIGSLFGTAGASLAGYKMTKRLGEIQEFSFKYIGNGDENENEKIPLIKNADLSSTIAISGWITDYELNNFSAPWKNLCISREQYCLQYEPSQLYDLGKAIETSTTETIKYFASNLIFFPGLLKRSPALMGVSALMGVTSLIDLPWSVCCSKAELVGKHLAQVLLDRDYGHRPVTLIGYSIGARVIYYCLLEMSERENSVGIIEDVYVIGSPCPADPVKWRDFTKIVSGTITNAYSDCDNLLKFLYRTLSLPGGGVAGLKCIDVSHKRLRNVNLSHIIKGHGEYTLKLTQVLKRLEIKLKSDEINRLQQPCSSITL